MIVVASVLLGAVFVVSGVTKVASTEQWRSSSADLGVPWVVAAVVPYVELAVGAMLVAQLFRRAAAVAAGAMLLGFSTLLIVRLAQGRRPPCACFGRLSAKPISWTNVARNVAFFVLAAVVAFG